MFIQEMGSQTLESMLVCRNVNTQQENKAKAADMQALKCPRCDSANTKFCYYNNYSLSQPRYFCKSCRRYWTKGGTLRNVPVGGGCRKNKRSSSSSSSTSSSKRADQPLTTLPTPLPSFSYESNDLSLAIARLQKQSGDDFSIWANPNMPHHHGGILGNFGSNNNNNNNAGLFDALRTGFLETPAQNLYYGMGNGNNLELENGIGMGMGMSQGMGIPFEDFSSTAATTASTAVTTVKQEICGGREGESRVLWGFPWQNVGGGGTSSAAAAEFDSSRLNWNGIGASNWQGLLNSPLM